MITLIGPEPRPPLLGTRRVRLVLLLGVALWVVARAVSR